MDCTRLFCDALCLGGNKVRQIYFKQTCQSKGHTINTFWTDWKNIMSGLCMSNMKSIITIIAKVTVDNTKNRQTNRRTGTDKTKPCAPKSYSLPLPSDHHRGFFKAANVKFPLIAICSVVSRQTNTEAFVVPPSTFKRRRAVSLSPAVVVHIRRCERCIVMSPSYSLWP